jgi:hypothetical protein
VKRFKSVPHWISMGEIARAEFDGVWYTDEECFWRFRAIHHQAGLDYVPDRGGFTAGQKSPERLAFIQSVLGSKRFADWVKQQRGDSDEVFAANGNGYHLRATNNRSHGYTYLWAWWHTGD